MSYRLMCLFTALCLSFAAKAQVCNHTTRIASKTTLADLAEDKYDIKHLRLNLNVTDTSVYLSGDVATTAQVVADSMPQYVFELDSTLTIDSAKVNGTLLTTTLSAGSVRRITLPTALPMGAMFTARIYYHGLPPGGGGGFFNGITHSVTSGGTHCVFTVSDPYVAKNWWPSKQSIPDKIDSVDMYVRVPNGVTDGSNGLLVGIDSTSVAGHRIFHWKTNYPIAYYLISIAVARYSEYKSYHHFGASSDSVLIQNFFMDTTTFNPLHKAGFDSIGHMMEYFSTLFGRYPFWREKYGVCYTTLPGGMEHQTMTTIGVPSTSVIAHELCHQWFGDNVTYKTWGDVWLSEGFATFSEQLYYERFWGAAAAKANRSAYLSLSLSKPCGKVYVDDTTTSDSLFASATVYAKGSLVARMLQYAAPSDSVFFALLRNYQNTFALGHASTTDLKNMAESIYGVPLDTFFNQWIYGRGFPRYKVWWHQAGTTVFVKLVQLPSCASATPLFATHLQLQLKAATADTFIKVYNNTDTQYYSFDWTPTMTNLYLNPDIWTLCTTIGAIVRDPSLGLEPLSINGISVSPNPASEVWNVSGVTPGTTITLADVNGKVLWETTATTSHLSIPARQLASGNYLLRAGGGAWMKVVKW